MGGGRTPRPRGLSLEASFRWWMPGDFSPESCWEWPGPKNKGYGLLVFDGRSHRAHVVSHKIFNGHDPISDDKPYVLHSCDNPSCVNPFHLWAGTHDDNMRDKFFKGRCVGLRGEDQPSAKLSNDTVVEIRKLNQQGISQRDLARHYGVSQRAIWRIVSGDGWKHVS